MNAHRQSPTLALISVSDKSGVADLARAVRDLGIGILSTGGTFRAIAEAGVPVTEVADHTGFPELMDGRVKTLHPHIHGGILARRGIDDETLNEHAIAPIDLVVVNLYPFAQTIARPDCTDEMALENIDIGGPAMLRAAAKNHRDVLVVVDPGDYAELIAALRAGGADMRMRRRLAEKAFRHTANYDRIVSNYLGRGYMGDSTGRDEASGDRDGGETGGYDLLPDRFRLAYAKREDMRYGENPHQRAAFYVDENFPDGVTAAATILAHPLTGTVAGAQQIQGKALSFNNVADTDAALKCVAAFDEPACVIVKHANPCGVALGANPLEAYRRAFATDPTSAFGGIVAFNRELDGATLTAILDAQFVEVVVAPSVSAGAAQAARAKKNVRLLGAGPLADAGDGLDIKRVGGGLLVQTDDTLCLDEAALRTVTERAPDAGEMRDLMFAWRVAWFVKSNAIVYARDGQTIGVGAGQMSRVVSARIAGMKAREEGLTVPGSVMASDAFFPFRDGIDAAAEAGIAAVIQPGGSMRDAEVIEAANEQGMAMVFTGVRHFRH